MRVQQALARLRLDVLAVGDAGIVLRVSWYRASFLLPVGTAGDALAALASSGQDVQSSVLLVPAASGAGAGTMDPGVVEAVRPWAAVVSTGPAGPGSETLGALAGYTVLRTDRSGWISFATDGVRLWAETER